MHENASAGILSPPVLVYLGMGLLTARMQLEHEILRDINWLKWLQFLVRVGSIILLWPLVLFIEKFEHWVKSSSGGKDQDDS